MGDIMVVGVVYTAIVLPLVVFNCWVLYWVGRAAKRYAQHDQH